MSEWFYAKLLFQVVIVWKKLRSTNFQPPFNIDIVHMFLLY